MASIIPGYEYDIFISYRQKDNKYDGWVTEFVENLKRELDSMFKEEISVYFDINPSDYLLENYDVDASLKDKLRCLIFIPVISRTYCDPNAFAWQYEFKSFLELASTDEFGLMIKLPNGNIANRVLPVRIHDLDKSDITLFESTMGSVIRPIDFIYKESGVNRQLRAKDDDIIKSPGHALYRDQINKVALAIREIILGMKLQPDGDKKQDKGTEDKKAKEKQKEITEEPVRIDKEEPKSSIKPDQTGRENIEKQKKALLKPKWIIQVVVVLIILTGGILLLNRRAKVNWAKNEGLQEIENLFNEDNYVEAFNISEKVERYIPRDSTLKELLLKVRTSLAILTDPPGADVYWKKYSDTSGSWKYIGKTPIDSISMPVSTFYRFMVEKTGYETVCGATSTYNDIDTVSRRLFKSGEVPPGMVYVDGYWDEVKDTWEKDYGFFIDKYEVTNIQFKEFVDHGGYRNPDYWKHEFIKEDKKISWEEAMSELTDKTGRPGPSTWEAGVYPQGQDDYPVGGISWYEAAAYAEFAGKVLPTADHWDSSVGFYWFSVRHLFGPDIYPLSNIFSEHPLPVGRKEGISCFGVYDMPGNAREWCFNESSDGRIICGAGWDDPSYVFEFWSQLPPFDRSPQNGFRCALYIDKEKIPETAFRFIEMGTRGERDYSLETPVPDQTFRAYKAQFLYDKTELDPIIEARDNTAENFTMEKVAYNTAYGKERMVAYLFLPKNASPPYQTLIFFPGASALRGGDPFGYIPGYIEYILNSGRAVMFPIYFDTYERNKNQVLTSPPQHTHQYTENLIKWVKDFSRSVDYLETRSDIDIAKLGYYGHSWGGRLGGVIPAVEERLRVSILILAGFTTSKPYPVADDINYVSRVKIPTLILSGKYDADFDLNNTVLPFFNLLGTPDADKRLCIYDAGHYIQYKYRVKEVLGWLDKYFGPPDYTQK